MEIESWITQQKTNGRFGFDEMTDWYSTGWIEYSAQVSRFPVYCLSGICASRQYRRRKPFALLFPFSANPPFPPVPEFLTPPWALNDIIGDVFGWNPGQLLVSEPLSLHGGLPPCHHVPTSQKARSDADCPSIGFLTVFKNWDRWSRPSSRLCIFSISSNTTSTFRDDNTSGFYTLSTTYCTTPTCRIWNILCLCLAAKGLQSSRPLIYDLIDPNMSPVFARVRVYSSKIGTERVLPYIYFTSSGAWWPLEYFHNGVIRIYHESINPFWHDVRS